MDPSLPPPRHLHKRPTDFLDESEKLTSSIEFSQ